MNEYKNAVMELVLVIGKKAKRIKELEEENERLQRAYTDMTYDLAEARKQAQGLRNDLFDLSKEFTDWKNINNKFQEKKSEWDKHQDIKNGCTGPK